MLNRLLWISLLMLLWIFLCAIFITRLLGQDEDVVTYAYAGTCRDEAWSKYGENGSPSEEDILSFDPESPKMACNIYQWFGTVRSISRKQ